MATLRSNFRIFLRSLHLWLGLIAGLLFCLMGVTGGIVSLRPQIAAALSPASPDPQGCSTPMDWSRAEQEVTGFAHAAINRIYAPEGGDPRWHFRMRTGIPAIYTHVIYDHCAKRVLGTADLAWLDWTVDLHHNLLAGRSGRGAGGLIGIAMLVSAITGVFLWLLASSGLARFLRIRSGELLPRDSHRIAGMTAGLLLSLAAFTSLWLCFPQTMRWMLAQVLTMPPAPARAPRDKSGAGNKADLAQIIAAAQRAIPDGSIREIRLPEGNGNVQVRMRRAGDFRSLGNNVVDIDSASAQIASIDLYSAQPVSGRFLQAMAGLHYGDWGGFWFRSAYALAGVLAAGLFLTGTLMWWLPKRRKSRAMAQVKAHSLTA